MCIRDRDTIFNSDPEIIITDKSNFHSIASIPKLRSKTIYVLAEKEWFEKNNSNEKEILSVDNLLGHSSEFELPNQHYGETTSILWTSGTTGAPKGVMQSNNTWIRSALSSIELGEIKGGDIAFNCMPLYNSAAWVTSIYPALLTGTTCAIDTKFSASKFWDRTRYYSATHIFTLGAMHMFLWNLPRRSNDGENPVRSAQMIPMADEIIPLFKKRFNINALHEGFGVSEIMHLMRRHDNLSLIHI